MFPLIDIEQELSEVTEIKQPGSENDKFVIEEQTEVVEQPIQTEQPEPPKMLPSETADIAIGFIDAVVLQFGGLKWYENKNKDKFFASRAEFEAAEPKYYGNIKETDDDKKQYSQYEKYVQKLEKIKPKLPLTADEYEKLKKPVASMIEKAGGDLPPGMALVILGLEIILPRLALD